MMEDGVRKELVGSFREMKKKIEEIERLTLELKMLGKGMPFVESNARSILSITHVLRFGISDVAEIQGEQGEKNERS